MGVVAPGFSLANFTKGGWGGADEFSLAAIPGIFRHPLRHLVLPGH